MEIFNTLGRKKKEFIPLKSPWVTFYQCGPTVYWVQHLGNMRAMVLSDLIRRALNYFGYRVKFARNYTDVGHLTGDDDAGEDKLESGAKREGLSPQAIANKYIIQFEKDTKELNCLEPDYKPRATEYIKPMAEMVQTLLDKGLAYSTGLAVYFDVQKYIAQGHNYTELSGQKLEKNISEAGKGEVGDKDKKSPLDFALWFFKVGTHQNALQTWDWEFKGIHQPSKAGFPGWHLECSAMNKSLFGPTVDLHMGGVEHIPVHHTNEIAQSEAANGKKFVRYWIHNEHLTVNGAKMSKSGGTAYSLKDIVAKGYEPLALRYFFLGAHYRSKQNFTWEALAASAAALLSLRSQVLEVKSRVSFWGELLGRVDRDYKQKFTDALADDFNLPLALSLIWEVLKSDLSANVKYKTIMDFDRVLGLKLNGLAIEKIPAIIKNLADKRWQAKTEKNWAEADRLREEITKNGWLMEDSQDGYKLKKK